MHNKLFLIALINGLIVGAAVYFDSYETLAIYNTIMIGGLAGQMVRKEYGSQK